MRVLATALLGVAVATAPALAQKAPEYDTSAEVTVTGVVVATHEATEADDHPGLHFVLRIGPAPEDEAEAAEEVAPAVPAAGEPEEAAAPEGESAAPEVPAAAPEPPAAVAPGHPAAVAPEPPAVEAETVEVHACPMDLLGYLDFKVEKGDELTVTGSRPGDGSVIVARELVKGEVKLRVRDEEGVPIWTDLE
jgi:hypothetical protein